MCDLDLSMLSWNVKPVRIDWRSSSRRPNSAITGAPILSSLRDPLAYRAAARHSRNAASAAH
jgi:hypothetical protein